jgi:hypothetical protein
MPLINSPSKKAFEKNIRTEIVQGKKPPKQAVAIAYAVKRKAHKAKGGSLDPMHYDSDEDYYEARKAAGVPERPKGYTEAQRNAIISGDIMKGERAKRRTEDEARQKMYAANAGKTAEYDKKIRKMVNENRKKKGMDLLPELKSGGKLKHSCW